MTDSKKDAAKAESPPKTAAQAAPKQPVKRAKRAKRRTVRSVLREVFAIAPGDLLEEMENNLNVDTLTALGKLDEPTANQAIYDAFATYAEKVVAGDEEMPQAFEEELRKFADSQRVNYDSMLVPRGTQYLINAMYSMCGGYGYQTVLDALDAK